MRCRKIWRSLATLAIMLVFAILLPVFQGCSHSFYTTDDFYKVRKTDAHFHYVTTDLRFLDFARSLNMQIISPNVDSGYPIEDQWRISTGIMRERPGTIRFLGTFSVKGFNDPGFADTTLHRILKQITEGAVGIKIWKNIGMELKNCEGKYVLADDPGFAFFFDYMEKNRIPVLAHLGEPRNCWLPLDKMTDTGDRDYYLQHPEYHMFLHPEMPSYERQVAARDSVLARHPGLIFVGAHLGSLEWSIEELAKRFDRYPNFSVDMASRIGHLKNQSGVDYRKVRRFLIRYQDRILYGTDQEIYDEVLKEFDQVAENARKWWLNDWLYLATDSVVDGIRGLKLPARVIDKIYGQNAEAFCAHSQRN